MSDYDRTALIDFLAANPGIAPQLLKLLSLEDYKPAPVVVQVMVGDGTVRTTPATPLAEGLHPTDGSPAPPVVADANEENPVFITDLTQRGFDDNLAPELDRMLTMGVSRAEVAVWAKIRLRDAFRVKDGLYLMLIRSQSTFETEEAFRLSLERAINIWERQGAPENAG